MMRMLPDSSLGALPDAAENGVSGPLRIPHRFWRHFWDTNPRKLILPHEAHQVADRLIRSRYPEAFRWARLNLPVESLSRFAGTSAVDARTRSMRVRTPRTGRPGRTLVAWSRR